MLNRNKPRKVLTARLFALSACVMVFALVGCERKERVLDVQTPAGNVKVDKNIDTGGIEVKTNTK